MIKPITLTVLLIVAFVTVGTMDYNDAVVQESYHCEMVKQGYYPKHMCVTDHPND